MSDGNLPATLTALDNAVNDLCAPITTRQAGKTLYGASRYQQCVDAIHRDNTHSAGGNGTKSKPPCRLQALDIVQRIDVTVRTWAAEHSAPKGHSIPGLLEVMVNSKWRPQDCELLDSYTKRILGWVSEIDNLLDPPVTKELDAPCPNCAATHTWTVKDGERVKNRALTATTSGATCGNCKTFWAPEYFRHLGRLIGCDTPQGLLD